jgi:SynChlorMet cassette radical SAM/SPASM protein ScmF
MGCEPELLKNAAKPATTRKLDLPDGVPPLTSLYMYIAGSCNLACRHCWISPTYEPDNSQGQFLKLEYIKKAVAEAKPLGLQSVKLTGGEPMLHPQIRELIEWLDSQGIDIIIESNGTLINNNLAKFLKSKPNMHFISVSIDGATAATHEALRGVPNSFTKAISGIKSLVKAGFKPQLICTLHRGNMHDIEAVTALAEKLGCGSVKFNMIQTMGRGENFSATQKLSIVEIINLYQMIEKNKTEKSSIAVHFDIPPAFRAIKTFLNDQNGHCNVLNIIGILASGKISLCGVGISVPELIYGDIAKQNMRSIWLKARGLNKLRVLIPNHFKGICAECLHHWSCLGACIAQNYHEKKQLNGSFAFCKNAHEKGLFPASRLLKKS